MSELKDVALELKELGEDGVFEGYASVFDEIDSVNDVVLKGAFKKTLAEAAKKKRMPPMLWQHNTAEPIGKFTEMREDSRGLFVKGQLLVGSVARAKEAYNLLKEGVLTGLSIGYRTLDSEFDKGLRKLKELDLLEVSLVTFPANDSARVALKKSLDAGDVPSERELEAVLREVGFSRQQAKGIIAKGYKALGQREVDESLVKKLNELAKAISH
jgi:HK97 family phage prohead protease